MTQSTEGRTEGGYAWAGNTASTQPNPAGAPTAPTAPQTPAHGSYGSPHSPYSGSGQTGLGSPHSGSAGTVLPPTDAPGNPHAGEQPAGPGAFYPPPPPAPPKPHRNGPGWFGVGAVGIGAAVLASLLTAGLITATEDDASPASTTTTTSAAANQQPGPVTSSSNENPDWEAVATAVQPSVVAVQVSAQGGSGEGSGVIIDKDGRILTNNHVVSGAAGGSGQIRVSLSDGRGYAATVVGTDPSTDLAVIKLDNPPSDLKPATLGTSEAVTVGQNVMAVGNPLGLSGTVTTGIVSAVDRPVTTQGESASNLQSETVTTNAIQTDAAVNPGNSGGALVDAQGRVIGINSSIASLGSGSGQSGSIGLGFAIPIDEAKYVAEQLTSGGTVAHAWLGVGPDDGEVTVDGASREAAQLKEIIDGSPAESAGLKAGDYVIAVDGDTVNSAESLVAQLHQRQPNQQVTLTVVRDGKAQDIKASLGTRPATNN